MSKTRIIETDTGRYMPQFKEGLLWGWRFFKANADQDRVLLILSMSTRDPAQAASFASEADARAFIDRVSANAQARNETDWAASARELEGVGVKRRITVPSHRG